MNILYINHYAGSPKYGMEYRPYHLAKKWHEKGHKVKILAASYSHVRSVQPKITKKTSEMIDGIDYTWYPTPRYEQNGVARVKNILTFLKEVWSDSKNIVKEFQPNIVIASSTYPMDIWIAQRISKLSNAKLIYEVHDLWPLSPVELGGMSPKHPFIQLCQFAENTAYKKSDAVVSILPKVHEHMEAHGLDLKKLHIIQNGIVEEDWQINQLQKLEEGELKNFLKEMQQKGKFLVGYTGAHGHPNALDSLLQAAKLILNENNSIVFVLVGSGLEKQSLKNKVIKEKINNVFFFDPVPKAQIPVLLKYFDITYIAARNTPIYRFGISPNKLMDYMMAAKPIICAIKAGNDPVTEASCGITVEPENPQAIVDAVLQLKKLSNEERLQIGKSGHDYVKQNQTYSILSDKFLEVMQNA